MPKRMAAVVVLVSVMSVALSASAQTPPSDDPAAQMQRGRGQMSREAGRMAREMARAANIFSEAAVTYADIINLSLTDRAGAVRLNLSSARGELTRLRPYASDQTIAALESRLREMEAAEANGNLSATALAAAEAFKLVITEMNPQMRRLPLEVSLYTYSAFKLVALASAAQIDWAAAGQAAKESERSWIALRRMVRDANLRVLLSEIQSGLRDAVGRNDAPSVKFAARLQVGSTAVLRDFFSRMAQAMARSRGGDTSQLSR